MKKAFLSIMLALALCLGVLPVMAAANAPTVVAVDLGGGKL